MNPGAKHRLCLTLPCFAWASLSAVQGAMEWAGSGAGALVPWALPCREGTLPAPSPCAAVRSAGLCWCGTGAGAGSQGGTACHAVRAAGYPQLSTGESGMEVGVWLPGIIDDTCTEITVPEQGDGGDQPCSCAVSP